MRAVYAGCGTDVLPLLAFHSEVSEWVLLDSQPASEFGHDKRPGFERPGYTLRLKDALRGIGLVCVLEFPDHLVYAGTAGPTVYVWPNTALPLLEPPKDLQDQLARCDTVCVCGHDPHVSLLSYIKRARNFVTDFKTVLTDPEPEGIIGAAGHFQRFASITVSSAIKAIYWRWRYKPDDRPFISIEWYDSFDALLLNKHV